ncbi:MAG: cell division protein FtsB [Gammaproteobacteria bacterium]|nr:cell division protein FtsB [Gammaproteobacteria bacterium]
MARLVFFVLLALFLLLQYRLWVSDDGMREAWRLSAATQEQRAENTGLEERNRALEAEVRDLKAGLEAIEERARSDLGMIRSNESFYQVVLPDDGDPSARRGRIARQRGD